MTLARAVLLAGTLVAALTTSPRASAFCRSTTCNAKTTTCATDAAGCVTDGAPLRWRKLPLTFRFSAQPPGSLVRDEARAAIRAAFYIWSDTLCGPDQRRTALRFVEGEDLFEDKPLVPNSRASQPYGIFFRDRGWPYTDKDKTLAQTNTLFGTNSGFIEYADMEINTGTTSLERFSTGEGEPGTDLQAVITHEVGHYIGLAHSKVQNSIMLESYCVLGDGRCERGKVAARRLSQDDIDAVCTLYSPDYVSPDDASAGGCATAPSDRGESSELVGFGLFVILGAAAHAWGVRRRRVRVVGVVGVVGVVETTRRSSRGSEL